MFVAVERAPLSEEIAETPYGTYSPDYVVATPAEHFTCRREPYGLAGSEHTIYCSRRYARIHWSTIHD